MKYQEFLESKRLVVPSNGFSVDPNDLNSALFPFQRDLVRWSLRKGRSALFCDTGLGKTIMQLEWARNMTDEAGNVLILAPLAVAHQTVAEGERFGYSVAYARDQTHVVPGITITNYEMLHRFDPSKFAAVVLDESSILKSFDGKIRTALIQAFRKTPYRLCCTATPAPNDVSELANHAEFLGVMSREDMLATFFTHDSNVGAGQGGWRLKGHAEEGFYRWLASWSMSVRKPSDLGYTDDGYELPPLAINFEFVADEWVPEGQLFASSLHGIQDRSAARKATLDSRCRKAADLVMDEPFEPWLVWCGLNDEGERLCDLIPGSVLVEGSDSPEEKAEALRAFAENRIRVLITKPTIAGFGMNFQHCARMVFVGLSDSYEQYYQAIRRCYRFGQQRPVDVYVVLAQVEDVIAQNILRKEEQAVTVSKELVKHVAEFEREELAEHRTTTDLPTGTHAGKAWRLFQGDACEWLTEIESESVDFTLFSPPFGTLYAYSPSERDLGNSRTRDEFFRHFGYVADELLRVIKPGRLTGLHVQQEIRQKVKDGVIGLHDLRGDFIRCMEERGFIYHGEICIDKDPQAQAIRTKSKGLLFVQLRKDASWMRPALADYILLFRKPGENAVPIKPDITNDEWIEWARPIWYKIHESKTLNVQIAREDKDERHICPLQLETIERCIRLWSNPGETVLDPFAGIGSTGYEAIRHHRKFIGVELKPNYAAVAVKNLRDAENSITVPSLFDNLESDRSNHVA